MQGWPRWFVACFWIEIALKSRNADTRYFHMNALQSYPRLLKLLGKSHVSKRRLCTESDGAVHCGSRRQQWQPWWERCVFSGNVLMLLLCSKHCRKLQQLELWGSNINYKFTTEVSAISHNAQRYGNLVSPSHRHEAWPSLWHWPVAVSSDWQQRLATGAKKPVW